MRVIDGRGIEYEVTYDAEQQFYVYKKVFKAAEELHATQEWSPLSTQMQGQAG
jgi:hypothetical protein